MNAAWIDEWDGPLRLGDRPDPRCEDGEVLIDVEACGVGLTVLNCIRGDLGRPADLPRVPGHELVGRIAAVGAGVDAARVGERVMAYFYLFCGTCRMCVAELEPMCERLTGYVGVHRDGGYAQRVVLPARNAAPVPDTIAAAAASAIPDAIATPVHAARRARIGPCDRVAVIAAGGGVGIHMIQVAALRGASVVGLDAMDSKLAYLRDELGFDAIDSSNFAAVRLPRAWDAGADVVVDLLGNRASLDWSLRVLAPNGRLVLLTTFRDVDVTVSPRDLVLGQGAIMGSRYASRAELALTARLVAEERVRPVVGRVVMIDELESAHDDLRAGRLLGRGALVWQNGED